MQNSATTSELPGNGFNLSATEIETFQENYRKVSNISRTKSQNLNASRLIL